MAATVNSQNRGEAAFLWIKRMVCLKLQKVSGN